jgi:lysyl-tRNA synthetase class I
MSLQYRLPDQAIRADPWTLFCAECSRKMRIMMATPARAGRETRTYECACGHSERIDLGIPKVQHVNGSRSQAAEKNV